MIGWVRRAVCILRDHPQAVCLDVRVALSWCPTCRRDVSELGWEPEDRHLPDTPQSGWTGSGD